MNFPAFPNPIPSGKGRPRKKGARQLTLQSRLHDPRTAWEGVELAWYNGQIRTLEIATGTACWFHFGKPALPIRPVLVRDPAGQYDTIALLCTGDQRDAQWIVESFVQRWQVEVTFEEARRHLGVESQRQWSDKAIARTTPILLGLFSWVTLLTEQFHREGSHIGGRQSAWYPKARPTFSDALAFLRRQLWQQPQTFLLSHSDADMVKIPRSYLNTLLEAACYVA